MCLSPKATLITSMIESDIPDRSPTVGKAGIRWIFRHSLVVFKLAVCTKIHIGVGSLNLKGNSEGYKLSLG